MHWSGSSFMLIFWIIVFILLSAFFSGTEIAFFTANKLGVEVKKNKGSSSGKILSYFYDHPDQFISLILIGNNIALVSLTYLLTSFFQPFFEPFFLSQGLQVFLSTLLVTAIILVFGEFLPKVLFRLVANDVIGLTAYPLAFFHRILFIPSRIMSGISNFFIRKLSNAPLAQNRYRFSILDLEHYLEGPMNLS